MNKHRITPLTAVAIGLEMGIILMAIVFLLLAN